MRYIGIMLLMLSFCCSCQNKHNKQLVKLVHKELAVDQSMVIGAPIEMKCIDGNLIIVDGKSEYFFHWIKLPNFRYMGSFGMHGQGPEEFLKVRSLHVFNDTLYAYDSHKSELFQVIPDDKTGKLLFNRCSVFPKSLVMDIFPLSEDRYCAYGCFEQGMFHLTDTMGTVCQQTRDYPARDKTESQLSNQIRFMAYQGSSDTDGEGRMVYLTAQSKQRYVYSLQNDSLVELAVCQETFPQYTPDEQGGLSVSYASESPLGYQDVVAAKDYFYGLYSGKSIKEYREKAFECSQLDAYTWNGELSVQYDLDVPVLCICLDSDHQSFYGIANLPDPTLVEFSIN